MTALAASVLFLRAYHFQFRGLFRAVIDWVR